MADYKAAYSDISKDYVENTVPNNEMEQFRYNKSKAREAKHNDEWLKNKVNLNVVVDTFVPSAQDVVTQKTQGGVKYVFEGSRYQVICDKAAGYLRIYDKQAGAYCELDGTPSKKGRKTHFKILRREEM